MLSMQGRRSDVAMDRWLDAYDGHLVLPAMGTPNQAFPISVVCSEGRLIGRVQRDAAQLGAPRMCVVRWSYRGPVCWMGRLPALGGPWLQRDGYGYYLCDGLDGALPIRHSQSASSDRKGV